MNTLPPHDIDAEQAVLGCMLLSSEAAATAAGLLAEADFFRPAHQIVFAAIVAQQQDGQPADPITIADRLTRTGELSRIGGAPYLHTLMQAPPTTANLTHYARIVAEHAHRRGLITAGQRLAQLGYADTAEDTAARAADLVTGITTPDRPWDTPVPLGTRGALPVFPAHVFPGWLADFVCALAEETQTPPDLAGCIALAAVSTAAGGRAIVCVRGTWTEPVNIYTVVAMPPGSRKSPVFRAIVTPLLTAEKILQERIQPQITEAKIAQKVAREAAEKATAKATTARGETVPDALAEAQSAALAVEDITIPVVPRLVSDDATPETATTLLAEQGGRLAVLSAEGGIFATLAGRYSGTPNLDLFLKGHAGDLLIVDRRDRRERIDNPALTLGLAVQPEIITELARSPGFRGKGLLGRILYSLPASNVGYRNTEPDAIPDTVSATYATNLERLVMNMHGWEDPARLILSPEAAELFVVQRRHTEPRLRPHTGDLNHIADWAAKFDGAVARIAGLLHMVTHIDDGWRHPIAGTTMAAAMELGEYFTGHALAAFDAMGADPEQEAARVVHEWLSRARVGRFTRRDAHRALQRRFKKAADLEPAFELLEHLGWIRREPEAPGTRGNPSPRYAVHPDLCRPTA
ncbi:DUF3987 domain-containing protein [Sphaerisporangium fuscum]|uniref:DUF3987 domain-containing protein n=1 Tax=Sphaerisporangium fuscum TaxID=2835868 RepID=UPI001BDC5958|nr:DUF3987 domain-containing protein [Sphaerisporangium fuscum]